MQFGFRAPETAGRFETVANELLQNGFSWIEVSAARSQDSGFLAVLERLIKRYEPTLSVHCLFEDVNPAASVPLVREAALAVQRQDLDFAARIGAVRAVIHSGKVGWADSLPIEHPLFSEVARRDARTYEKHLRIMVDSIRELAAYAAERGVQLTVENEFLPIVLFKTPQQGSRLLVEELGSQVPMTLDTGHAVMAGYSPAEYVDTLGGLIVHTHIHDNDGIYDMHHPLGTGKVALVPAIPRLVALNPEVTLLLEQPSRSAAEMLDGRQRLLAVLVASGLGSEPVPVPLESRAIR